MRMAWLGLVGVLGCFGIANAQPGAPPPPPPPRYQPTVPPPYGYATITRDEHELLLQGEISDDAHIGGGLAALMLGFGSGQAIQGRWSDTGWIFTLGESASFALLIAGAVRSIDGYGHDSIGSSNDDGEGMLVVGLVGFSVFRVWEIIDAFGGPGSHNRRVRELKWRLGIPQQVGHLQPYLNRTRDHGATAGLQLRF